MARIRSTHPTQWTDENFVSCSPFARLLAIAIRNDADDNGLFEWKPLQIKMRLFPADNVNIDDLLSELVETRQIRSAEINGRKYGAIRNFTKFQRPKKPNPVHPISDELRTYVGLKQDSSPPVPHQDGTASENPPQMEDVGGKGKSNGDLFEDFWDAFADRRGKDGARRVWNRRRLNLIASEVIAGAKTYAANRGSDKKFWKQAQGWLNDGRWADEQPDTQSSKPLSADRQQVFVEVDTDEWDAWQATQPNKKLVAIQTTNGMGRYFPSKTPPQDQGKNAA